VKESDDTSKRAPADAGDWSVLMARAQTGDGGAYRRLLHEIIPYLRALAASRHRDPSDVEDAIQDILLAVHSVRHTYDPNRPFGPWLTTIAKRRVVDRLRRQGRHRAREAPLIAEDETFAPHQANIGVGPFERYELEAAVENLPPGQRQAINLLKLQEKSLKEASAITGMSIAALKVATHRALKSLRKMLSKENES
jgi:RNA polymerase sigma-70 factor (ECF subfamily)